MITYQVSRKEIVSDALNRGASLVLILASVITGAVSHRPNAFTMLFIFGSLSIVFSTLLLMHDAYYLITRKWPENNIRKAVIKLPLELVHIALLILCTYYGFSVRGQHGTMGLVDGNVSSSRVACGFLGLVASGAAIVHAPTAIVNCLKAKYAEHDLREKQNADAAARVV